MEQQRFPLDGEVEDDDFDAMPDFAETDAELDAEAAAKEVKETPLAETLSTETLLAALLTDAIREVWGDDAVMADFVAHVLPPLSRTLGHVTAKGGDFAEAKQQAGAQDADRYLGDQSQRAHLLNGLLPALHVAKLLQRWGAPQFDWYDDNVRRVAICGYVLHDWLKLPDVQARLDALGIRHYQVNMTQHGDLVRGVFGEWGRTLGLDAMLRPVGGLESLLEDVIAVAMNTQIKHGTERNLSVYTRLSLSGRKRDLAEQLSRLADYLAYVGRNPRAAATNASIHRELGTLSDRMATLVYHHVADVRGVLTNFINNEALAAMTHDSCVPLLYAPNGVVYLQRKGSESLPTPATVADQVVESVRKQARRQLGNSLPGFSRDGKGIKYADYYTSFFDTAALTGVGTRAAAKLIHAGKKPSAGKRYAKMTAGEWLAETVDLDLADDVRVDQLAEWCYLMERLLAGTPVGPQVAAFLLNQMGLDDLRGDFLVVPRDSRAGGVGYHWYLAAGHYLKRNPGLSPAASQERLESFAAALDGWLRQTAPELAQPPQAVALEDLRSYVASVVSFGPAASHNGNSAAPFATELHRYANAKRRGRGTTAMCSLCSSAYTVEEQREAAILFAPQVYSNKLNLHGAKAIRDICSICGLEMMLRQLFMNQSNAAGGDFEKRNFRYLYLYPTYFFTPETLRLVGRAYASLKLIQFTALRRQLVEESADGAQLHFDPETWQRLEPLLLQPPDAEPERDRFLRLRFADDMPITFFFLGVPPPGRDSKDAEAWVHPALLALLLPLCLDVKVVASESSLPLLQSADELAQTVYFDAPHAAIRYLVQTGGINADRINLDHLLPTLQRLAAAYLIHLDANARRGASFDYRWQDLPALARRLSESSLYAFHYLKKWQRGAQRDALPAAKVSLYLQFQAMLDSGDNNDMSHARKLTDLYRRFYRARRWNANSILRPLAVASNALLTADRRIFDNQEALVELVRGVLSDFVDRVLNHRADGFVPRIEVDGKKVVDKAAVSEFAAYFVNDVFFGALRGDVSALRGKQLNLLKSACEVIYLDMDHQERAAGRAPSPDVDETSNDGADDISDEASD